VVLYLPEAGLDDGPVGDDLMEWLNTHFIEPSTEEGDHLSGLERPWEDETFWPYLTRYSRNFLMSNQHSYFVRATLRGLSKATLFFLDILSRHPSEDLRRLSEELIPLIDSQPRLQNFTAGRDFAYASRRWNDKVKSLRLQLDRVPEGDRHDGFDNWWDRISDIVGVLEGREEVMQKICGDIGGDWKEVAVAWGVFVDTRLRRLDLP
jgi:nuclear pore complex protein Nup85